MSTRLLALAFTAALAAGLWAAPAAAQVTPLPDGAPPAEQAALPGQPQELVIRGLRVEGVAGENMAAFVLNTSGLEEGQVITLPGSPALAQAIRDLYDTRSFSDVAVIENRREDGGLWLTLRVAPEPRLVGYDFHGIESGHRDDLEELIPLLMGQPVRPSDVDRARQAIRAFYREEGYLRAEVQVARDAENSNVTLDFYVDRGPRAEVEDIRFQGNQVFSDRQLRRQFEETQEDRWWRFWKRETFDREAYEEDKDLVIDYYREHGYYDARIVSDSVYLADGDDVIVQLTVEEGDQYYVSDVTWEGNTVYSDAQLTRALGFEEGDVFGTDKLQTNLLGVGNRRGTDVASLYLNRGYLRFDVQPTVRVTGQDSVDLIFDVREGDVYDVGAVNIAGNTKTKDYVIRRELYTVPGQTFSRSATQESIRRLMQLNYFSRESLAGGPSISIDEEEQEVDLTYAVEEVGSDQLELSGTYGAYGIVLQLRFTFNNFSIQNLFNWDAYRPLPTGDGQQLSLAVQTNGRYYQNYSISFTEPWFRGKPQPIGGSVSFARYTDFPYRRRNIGADDEDGSFTRISTRVFYQRRLQWPDDRFMTSSAIAYRYYNNVNGFIDYQPAGTSQEVVLEQGISRSSLDAPIFPSSGSDLSLTLEVAPPLSRLFGADPDPNDPGGALRFVQYHKWRFKTDWHVPLIEDLTLSFGTDFGYIGSLTGEEVRFQRFVVGGSPFDYARFQYGVDPVFLRGYPARVIGPRRTLNPTGEPQPIGGRILNKYTTELRWLAVQSPQIQAAPYLFFDAANTWRGFETYNPASLYRAAGVGLRLFLPIVGLLEVSYGYNLDPYISYQDNTGERQWIFQFSLGQSF